MPNLDEQRFAEQYGFAYAFLRSNKDVYNLFKQAVTKQWTSDMFVSQLRGTNWFKQHSESYRKYQVLKSTDPATLNQRKAQLIAQLRDASADMGATPSAATLSTIADNALMLEWNDAQLKDTLSAYVRSVNGVFSGNAADTADQLRQVAWKNGLQYGSDRYERWAQAVAAGAQTVSGITAQMRAAAKHLAPGYAQELDAGQDLYDIASPYMQAKAKILEKNPADIDLFDNDVRQALSARTPDGKPASTSLWQFEQSLRKKPEWLQTKNSQDAINGVARRVISDFFGGA